MKKIIIPALLISMLAAFPVVAETLFATIDLEKIVKYHSNTERDKKLLQETLKDYEAQAQVLEAKAIEARKAFESAAQDMRNPALSEKAKKNLEEEAKAKYKVAMEAEQRALETKRNLQRNLTDQEIRMLKSTVDSIQDVVAKYSEEKGIKAVFPITGAKLGITPAILWSDSSLDITKDVMKIMNITEKIEVDAEDEVKELPSDDNR